MKIALIMDKDNMLSSISEMHFVLFYECFDGLKSFISRKEVTSFTKLLDYLYLSKIDLALFQSLSSEEKSELDENRINYFILRKVGVDRAIKEYFGLKNNVASSHSSNEGLKALQEFAISADFDHGFFDLSYYDDDEIGGS